MHISSVGHDLIHHRYCLMYAISISLQENIFVIEFSNLCNIMIAMFININVS